MLDQAGWLRGPDGIRAKGGVRLSFRFDTTAGSPFRPHVQALIQTDLRAVGIEVTTSQLSDLFDALAVGDFDFAEYAWTQGDSTSTGNVYDSSYIPTAANNFSGNNAPRYSNPHYDDLSRKSGSELDRSKQYAIQAELQAIYSEDLPSIPLFFRTGSEVHNPRLVNWDPNFGYSALDKVAAIYFR
jgi:peptide/nickel transport system substrate-binding protein